ncbi:hypothetical protein F4777DRAFT_601822 [Nemania sp. FL0916]|nr:hypothetical protein F4777DRAFT_601822 [Nemania sp. FL0916]
MRPSHALLPTLLLLFPTQIHCQLQNFWLSYIKYDSSDPEERHVSGGIITAGDAPPDWQLCDGASYDVELWPNRDDVSGGKVGMRCDPPDNVGFPLYRDPLFVTEFNTGKFWAGHQTIYIDRGYQMYDTEGRRTAQCYGERTLAIFPPFFPQGPVSFQLSPKIKNDALN